jgi:hypothetical protein
MKNMDSTLKDHSILSQLRNLEDTLKLSTTETWLLKLEMAKKDRSGGSTKDH